MQLIKKLNYIFTSKQKREIVGLFFAILVGSGLELLGVSLVLPVIQGIMNPQEILKIKICGFFYDLCGFTDVKPFIIVLLCSLVLVFLLKNIYLVFMYKDVYKFTFINRKELSNRMLNCYLKQPYLFHVSKNSAELLRNINTDADYFYGVIMASLKLGVEIMVCLALGIYLLIMDKTISLVIIVLMIIMMILFMKVYKKIVYETGKTNRDTMAEMNKWVQQSFGGIKEIKVLNKEKFFLNQYNDVCTVNAKSGYMYHTITYIPKPVMEVVCVTGLIGAIAIKYYLGASINYFVPIISVFAVAAFRLMPSFNRITEYLGEIIYKKSSIEAVYNDLKEIEELSATGNSSDFLKDSKPAKFDKEISIRELSFKYPETDNYVINNISFDIKKNESVAFIGPSGAGKTTLADVILGLLRPQSGDVYVDDVCINEDMNAWHKIIGYIPQSIYLIDDTIRNNIAFGAETIDEEKLKFVVEQAQLKELVDSLEAGLDTEIGEMGVRLSGGQRQRIGIARALYNNPQILVLDEATSALDNDTEAAVMEAIESLHGKITLIIIAHRLSTIESCDTVYEVKDGNIRKDR